MKFTRLVCLLCLGASLVGCQPEERDYQLSYRYYENARVITLDVENIPSRYIKEEMFKLGTDSANDGFKRTIVETVNGVNIEVMVFDENGNLICYQY